MSSLTERRRARAALDIQRLQQLQGDQPEPADEKQRTPRRVVQRRREPDRAELLSEIRAIHERLGQLIDQLEDTR